GPTTSHQRGRSEHIHTVHRHEPDGAAVADVKASARNRDETEVGRPTLASAGKWINPAGVGRKPDAPRWNSTSCFSKSTLEPLTSCRFGVQRSAANERCGHA